MNVENILSALAQRRENLSNDSLSYDEKFSVKQHLGNNVHKETHLCNCAVMLTPVDDESICT